MKKQQVGIKKDCYDEKRDGDEVKRRCTGSVGGGAIPNRVNQRRKNTSARNKFEIM